MESKLTYKIAIVGGGTGGLTVASRLSKKIDASSIVIIEPSRNHYYQPLWSLVSAGILPKEKSVKNERSLIPQGVHLIQDAVTEFFPEKNFLITKNGTQVSYSYLIVAPGLQINWNGIKGLKSAMKEDGVISIYSYKYLDKTWETIKNFKGGRAIFTQPNTPFKCGGAPQKIMYLAEDYFKKTGIRKKTDITFFSPKDNIFPVEKYARALQKVIKRKGITTNFKYNLVEIRPDIKNAIFEHLETGELKAFPYDLLHVTPPMSSPEFIKKSPLSGSTGWIDVDQGTLQHKTYNNIFSLGDVTNLMPTSKTGAAVRKQAPVVVSNLIALMEGRPPEAKYNGYTSCPIVTGYGKLILTEFGYNNQPMETFPFDQAKERSSMYFFKKELLPRLYWHGMLKGRM